MNEKTLEKKLKKEVQERGGKALKFFSPFESGWPDRIVLLPYERIYWVELKSTGKKLTALQEIRKRELESLGFCVFIVDSELTLETFLKFVDNGDL